MKECKSCNIKFNIQEELCPLCQNKLVGDCNKTIFPTNTIFRVHSLLLKILLFISVITTVISFSIEMYLSNKICISIILSGALLTNYIVVYYILKNKQNILELIGKNGLLIDILLILWFLYTKETIITNYIIPIVCLLELLFNSILFIILRKNYVTNYFKLIILNILLLLIPILLILLNWTTNDVLSYICFIFALILLLGMLIFYHDELKEEIEKIFNV